VDLEDWRHVKTPEPIVGLREHEPVDRFEEGDTLVSGPLDAPARNICDPMRTLAVPLALVISIALAGCKENTTAPATSSPAHEESGWKSFSNSRWGYEVAFPRGWNVTRESLSPKLTDPREILSIGTFPLHYRPTNCEAFAGSAQQDLVPGDVFVSVQEPIR
jgi:hypothetical protein